ncbi:MAG TPA: Uma2 family endonuclease [Bryobacteraceae bacterium]|nr:Uma2 family endonuclease [Bryobacteraceae bacterium]
MSARTLISVEDYLASSFEPDCDFVDGHIEERNMGEVTHARLQLRVGSYLLTRYEGIGVVVMTEVRVQVGPSRYRVPDICVTLGDPGEEVLTRAPFICIEILSPEDRMSRVQVRINDYLAMGVPYVWVLDPQTRQAFTATAAEGLKEMKSGMLRTENPVLELPLAESFR